MLRDTVTRLRLPWAIRCIFVASALILAGYLLAFGGHTAARLGALALAAGNAVIVAAAMALGAPLRGRWARTIIGVLLGTCVVLFTAVAVALFMPAPGPEAILLFGFPRPVAIVLYGVGVLPLLILPALFALSFDDGAFAPERLERLRALRPRAVTPEDAGPNGAADASPTAEA